MSVRLSKEGQILAGGRRGAAELKPPNKVGKDTITGFDDLQGTFGRHSPFHGLPPPITLKKVSGLRSVGRLYGDYRMARVDDEVSCYCTIT